MWVLHLVRDLPLPERTSSAASITDPAGAVVWQGFFVEDPVRPTKIAGETAIPEGRYGLRWTRSPRLERYTLRLIDVPGFAGILIHPGNSEADTRGCLLPGRERTAEGKTVDSRVAWRQVEALLKAPAKAGQAEVLITSPKSG